GARRADATSQTSERRLDEIPQLSELVSSQRTVATLRSLNHEPRTVNQTSNLEPGTPNPDPRLPSTYAPTFPSSSSDIAACARRAGFRAGAIRRPTVRSPRARPVFADCSR